MFSKNAIKKCCKSSCSGSTPASVTATALKSKVPFQLIGGAREMSLMSMSSGLHIRVDVPKLICCGTPLCQCGTQTKLLHSQINEVLDESDKIEGTHPDLADIIENSQKWAAKKKEEDPEYFKRFGAGQAPRYLVIGCSDARVDPKQILGLEKDEVFITRNIGNQVAPNDLNILSVLEFSIGVLNVPHIIVLGHYECGAIKGALAEPTDGGLGTIENWLRNVRDVARMHVTELNQLDSPTRHRRLVELNVQEQCFNVLKTEVVQRKRAESFADPSKKYCLPRVHGMVFNVHDGDLRKIDLPFKQDLVHYRPYYDLYRDSSIGESVYFWEGKKE